MADLLARMPCTVCGAPALAIPAQWDRTKCSACGRRAFDAYDGARTPWRPTIARILEDTSRSVAKSQPNVIDARAYRVLVPARLASASETPGGARELAAAVSTCAIGMQRHTRATYALAEDLRAGALIHSCGLRVYDGAGRALGYFMWINGQSRGGVWRGGSGMLRHGLGVAEFTALATGATYLPPQPRAPAAQAPCPRCGALVRWTVTGAPYKHRRDVLRGEGGASTREDCT